MTRSLIPTTVIFRQSVRVSAIEKMISYAQMLGLGQPTGINADE